MVILTGHIFGTGHPKDRSRPIKTRVWNGDGVTGDGGDGEVTGDKIFTGDITGDKIVTGEAFSPVKLVLKRDRYAQKSGFFRLVAGTAATYCPSQFFCR